MHLVNKYELGSPAGYGAMIDQRDVADLARAVYAIPDYHDIDPDAKLAANGVALSDEQSEEFYRRQMQRLINQDTGGSDSLASLRAHYASYEDYVTSDNELQTLLDSYRRGGDPQKKTALQKLLRIFLTIDQRTAVQLLQRLSALRKNDIVSERFQSALPASERAPLLAALRLSR